MSATTTGHRLIAIDALRGLVMVVMVLDHVRETFFLHHQVGDPMDPAATDPWLFLTRSAAMICAPLFVALTGLSAWLYGRTRTPGAVSRFLLGRGLLLMGLEVSVITLAWSKSFPPATFWLQVIWAIGISMCALAAFLRLPRPMLILLGAVIVGGHNLLDGIRLTPQDPLFVPWAMLHQRDVIALPFGVVAKTTYPVLPWIGVMMLGYGLGPWFAPDQPRSTRCRRLLWLGLGLIAAFAVLRGLNLYGDRPWSPQGDVTHNIMAFWSLTKYPPSLLFLLPSLGLGVLLLAWWDARPGHPLLAVLARLGGAPMFFYILHLWVLKGLYAAALALWGHTQGQWFGFDHLGLVWLVWLLLIVPLYLPTRWFAALRQRRRSWWVLRYF